MPAAVAVMRVEPFVLEAGTIQLGDLIDRVAAYLDYNLLCNESELSAAPQAGIRLTRRTEVDRTGCWELFNSLLYHQGFAILALDRDRGFYEVVFINGARGREIAGSALFVPNSEIDTYARLKAIPIVTLVSLHGINPTIATNTLRPFFAGTSPSQANLTLGNLGNSTDLLLQGFGPQVAAACRMLQLADGSDGRCNAQIQLVVLEHAATADIVERLHQTLMRAQAENDVPGMPPLRAVPHPALNAVLLCGSKAQINAGLELIARLDQPAKAPNPVDEDLQKRLQQLEQRVRELEAGQRAGK